MSCIVCNSNQVESFITKDEKIYWDCTNRVGRCLERQGLLEQDTESAWLELDPTDEADAMPHILGSSASYRIAVGRLFVLYLTADESVDLIMLRTSGLKYAEAIVEIADQRQAGIKQQTAGSPE